MTGRPRKIDDGWRSFGCIITETHGDKLSRASSDLSNRAGRQVSMSDLVRTSLDMLFELRPYEIMERLEK